MGKFYHGTDEASAKRILREGLDPNLSKRDDEPKKFAFLSQSKERARAFAPGGEYRRARGKKGVVLEVNPPKFISDKFRMDLGEYTRVPGKIPGRYLKIV